ncbi:RHOMBOID-like protein [Drosera capensis]
MEYSSSHCKVWSAICRLWIWWQFLSALFERSSISVGASGAVFGLLGGMLSELFMNRTIYTNIAGHVLGLVAIVSINLGLGILPHVDNFAHIGVFLSGFLLGFVLLIWLQHASWLSRQANVSNGRNMSARQIFLLLDQHYILKCLDSYIGFYTDSVQVYGWLGVALPRFDGNKHCSWCHYLSCVPTSRWSCDSQPSYCLYDQLGNQVNVTCQSNGRSSTYNLPNVTNSQMQIYVSSYVGNKIHSPMPMMTLHRQQDTVFA